MMCEEDSLGDICGEPEVVQSGEDVRATGGTGPHLSVQPDMRSFRDRKSQPMPEMQEIQSPPDPMKSSDAYQMSGNKFSPHLSTVREPSLQSQISSIKQLVSSNKPKSDVIKILKYNTEGMLRNPNFDRRLFYCLATQLYRLGEPTSICPLCLLNKEVRRLPNNKAEHPDCHIFPRSLLEEYKQIHCDIDDDRFIYNQFSDDFTSSGKLTFPLFCQVCDNAASKEERLLKKIYSRIARTKDKRLSISSQDAKMLKHILALLMFRGMLLGVNFLEEFSPQVMEKFELLRKYCSTNESNEYDQHSAISKQFHVFILPNTNYNIYNPHSTYIIDLQLRNPCLTTVVRTKDGDIHWYMKFDTFHCVLPVECRNTLPLESSCFYDPQEREEKKRYELPFGMEGFQIFPEFLWAFNLCQLGILAWQSSSLRKPCNLFLQDPQQETPLKFQFSTTPTNLPVESIENIPEESSYDTARSMSPLTMLASESMECSQLKGDCSQLKTAWKELQSKFNSQRSDYKESKSNLMMKKTECKNLQRECKTNIKILESEREKMRAEYSAWQKLEERLQQENKDLRRTITELQKVINARDKKIQELQQIIREMKQEPYRELNLVDAVENEVGYPDDNLDQTGYNFPRLDST